MPNQFIYQDVFGGANIYPSDISYGSVTLTSDVTYDWPLESTAGINNLLPRILDVTVNSYKTTNYTVIGGLINSVMVGATTLLLSGDQTMNIGIGSYITAAAPTTPAPVFYTVAALSFLSGNTSITLTSPFLNSFGAGQPFYAFAFTPWTITLPPASEAGLGQTTLFVSKLSTASYAVAAQGLAPNQILSASPGTAWQVYLIDNSTVKGQWSSFQFGAQSAAFQVTTLAGPGLTPYQNTLATAMPVTFFSAQYSAGAPDRARTFIWTGASGNFILPTSNAVGNNWFINVRNQGAGLLLIMPAPGSSDQVNNSANIALDPGDSLTIITDGVSNFYSLGYGRAISSNFNYTAIQVTGGDHPLTATEQNLIAYRFYGALTSNQTITVPQYVQQYWVFNDTTGSYSLLVRTAGGDAGQVVQPGKRAIYYCNGANIVEADNNGIALPLPIASGGTGSTTSDGALINLGGSGIGRNVFTATSTANALSAIGSSVVILNYLGVVNPSVGYSLLFSTNTTSAINALGGAAAINQALGAASFGDILSFAVALG